MNLSSLIANHGYLAVFISCFLEGETVLVLAAILLIGLTHGLLNFWRWRKRQR